MSKYRVIRICLLFILTGTSGVRAITQDTVHHVIDFVDLTMENGWTIEFHETWDISLEGNSIQKSVTNYQPLDCNNPLAPTDTLHQRFNTLIQQLPVVRGASHLINVSYEFMLLDPHIRESGNIAFPEPDSMDSWTRKLQTDLISLIKPLAHSGNSYDYNEQLLSVIFHEKWFIDPLTFEITKRVQGITPVMWQRRRTTAGEPVNEADTGLPVYYKNQLDRIDLRNP